MLKVVKGIDDFKDYFSKHSKMTNDDTHVSRSNDLALTVGLFQTGEKRFTCCDD